MNTIESRGLSRLARLAIVPSLLRTGISPEQISTARLILAALAALALAFGPAGYYVAAALLLLALVLDRTDGELACARGEGELAAPSQRYAFICDSFSHVLVFAGLGVGLRASEYGVAAIGMGLLAGVAVAAVPWMVRRLEVIDGKRADEFGGIAGLDADDMLLLAVPLALLAGWAQGLLFLAAAAAPTFASAFFLTHYRKFSAS